MFKGPKKTLPEKKKKGILLLVSADHRQVNSSPESAVILSEREFANPHAGSHANPQIVVVVDVSGSMQKNNVIGWASQSARNILIKYPTTRVHTFGSHDGLDITDQVPTGRDIRIYNQTTRRYEYVLETRPTLVRKNPSVITRDTINLIETSIVAHGGTDPIRMCEMISGPRPRIVVFILDGDFSLGRADHVKISAEYRKLPAGDAREKWYREQNRLGGRRAWEETSKRLVDSGILVDATHMLFFFPDHTKAADRELLLDSITGLLRAAGIGAKIVTNGTNVVVTDVLREMSSDTRRFASPLPDGYRRVIDRLGFHPKLTPETLGNYMWKNHLMEWIFILEELLRLAHQTPEILIDDPVWATIHKAMTVSSSAAEAHAEEAHIRLVNYRQNMADAKRSFSPGTRQRQALDKLYTLSYRNPQQSQLKLDCLKPHSDAIVGYLVHTTPEDVTTETEIIELGRQKARITGLIDRLRKDGNWRFVRRNGEDLDLNEDGTFIGMPVLDPSKIPNIKIVREMFSLLFIQWTPVPLTGILQWVVALSFIVRCDTPIESEVVSMIKAAFFGSESHTLDMLGLSAVLDEDGVLQPVIDTERRQLLYSYPILKMVVEVLDKHRNELFPNILCRKDPPKEVLVTPGILCQQIEGYRKALTMFHILHVIKNLQYDYRPITRKVQAIEEDGTGVGEATSLMPGDLVFFSKETTTRKKNAPWPSIPCLGVVTCAGLNMLNRAGLNEPIWNIAIDQLDQEMPDMLFLEVWFNCYNPLDLPSFGDRVRYTVSERKGLAGLGLIKLGGFMTTEGMIITDDIPVHLEKVRQVATLLHECVAQGNLDKKSIYAKWPGKNLDADGAQLELLHKVKEIMNQRDAQIDTVDHTINVPFEVILPCIGLPTCDTFVELIRSGANPNLEQLLELVSDVVTSPPAECPTVDYIFQKRSHKTVLMPNELAEFVDQIKTAIAQLGEHTGTTLTALVEIYCSICFDSFSPGMMVRFGNCRHATCLGCYHGDGTVEDPGLVRSYPKPPDRRMERLHTGNAPVFQHGCEYGINSMNLCCPECRIPIGNVDPRIDALFKTHNKTLPVDKRYRFCGHCVEIFEQNAPRCAEAIDAPEDILLETCCVLCRAPPMLTGDCPRCGVTTHKESGCDHITCRCGEHWCWRCCKGFGTAEATYAHMRIRNCHRGDAIDPREDGVLQWALRN